jgi:hypothetical protein
VFPEVHQSEWRWVSDDDNFTQIVENNSTIDSLKSTVKNFIS